MHETIKGVFESDIAVIVIAVSLGEFEAGWSKEG
jgi:translation elongation factor EF-1alpha